MSHPAPCRFCGSAETQAFNLPWPLFRHLDFTDVAASGGVVECATCGVVAAGDFDRVAAVQNSFLFESGYLAAAPTSHVVRSGAAQPNTRVARQAEWIAHQCTRLGIQSPAILDVGCFDGALLAEVFDHLPMAKRLAGFDTSPTVALGFPSRKPFEFHTNLEPLAGSRFDVIIASHSLMYERHLPETLATLTGMLTDAGTMIVIMPHILGNPPYLLMGDQYWFGSRRHLLTTLKGHGLAAGVAGPDKWGHDLVIIGSRNFNAGALVTSQCGSPRVPRAIDGLRSTMNALETLWASTGTRQFFVLGTTANAAFAHSVLGDRCIGFVDEAIPCGEARPFRGLLAQNPTDIADRCPNGVIVVGYGSRNSIIANRIRDKFGCRTATI